MATNEDKKPDGKRYKALVQINLDGRLRVPGTKSEIFTTSEETAESLLIAGAAEEVKPEPKKAAE